MTNAQEFLSRLASQDSATVYEALASEALEDEVSEDQDWNNEMSTWTFGDGSAIVMQGNDVEVIESLVDLIAEICDAVEDADVCAPEQVSDMCILAAKEGRDWKAVLAKAVESDAAERKTMGIE